MGSIFLALMIMLTIGTTAGAVLAIIYPFIRPGLLERQPRQRANALLGWTVAPAGVGIVFAVLLFIPSILACLDLPAGHCHNHSERLPHICLPNPLLSGSEMLPWYLVVLLTVLVVRYIASQLALLQKAVGLKAALRCAECEGGVDYNLVLWEKPAALTVGFWAPQISLVAVLKGHHSLSAGNLVGSDIFNLLGVLGLTGTLQSMTVSPEAYSSLFLLCGMVLTVVVMMRTGWQVSRFEGGILICIGMARWIMDFTR